MPDALDPAFRLGQRLHDIRLPARPEGWGAPELLWAGAAGLVLAGVVVWLWRRNPLRRAALAELERLRAAYAADGDAATLAGGLSVLLKRVALARFPRREVAGLAGEAWLRFLDRGAGEAVFTAGPGRALADLPYRPPGSVAADGRRLIALARQWILSNT